MVSDSCSPSAFGGLSSFSLIHHCHQFQGKNLHMEDGEATPPINSKEGDFGATKEEMSVSFIS